MYIQYSGALTNIREGGLLTEMLFEMLFLGPARVLKAAIPSEQGADRGRRMEQRMHESFAFGML